MANSKAGGTTGKKKSSSGGKTAKPRSDKTPETPASSAPTPAGMQAPAQPFPAKSGLPPRSATPSKAKDPLQASIERQSQLQLMIRTQNSARAWAKNVRQMQVFLLFTWFGLWSFLEPFLDIGHRVTHSWGLQSHRSAGHDVLIVNGAAIEGLFSLIVAVGVGLLIYKGVQKAVKT